MNASKLYLLHRRQWKENNKIYRIGLLAITGVLFFLFLIVWHWRDSFSGGVNKGIFLIGLFGGGCLFASSLLKDLNHPSKGMWLIGIPASAGEKILIAVLYATVFYLLAYISLFYITEGLFLWIVRQDGKPIERTDLFQNGFYNFLFTFINFQLLILMGCLSFKRGALMKTIVLMIIYFALTYNANNYLLTLMTGEKTINGSGIYDYFQFNKTGENVYVHLPERIQFMVNILFRYIIPATLYYIIYLKFRETEL